MKNYFSILVIIVVLTSSAIVRAEASGIIVSKLELSSICEPIAPTPVATGITAGVGASLANMVLKSVVGAGISFVSGWLEKWKDSYEGADSASTVGSFFCKTPNGALGHPREISYTRTQLAKHSEESNKEVLKIVSKIAVIPNDAALGDSLFTLQLSEIKYNDSLAKRGKNKDLTLNYSFSFAGADDEEVIVITDPIVLSRIAPGDHYSKLQATTGVLKIGKINSSVVDGKDGKQHFVHSPVTARLDLAETQVGNGIVLATQISSSLAASLKAGQEDLTGKFVQLIVGDELPINLGEGRQ